MEVIGYKEMDFKANDGAEISGYKVYCTLDMDAANSVGLACESFFVSKKRAQDMGYKPELHQEIELSYNKFAKIEKIFVA
ncbi:MAG: hypothetical protein ACOYEB_12670 [Enterococcus lemanii]|jgi:hypothetical protein